MKAKRLAVIGTFSALLGQWCGAALGHHSIAVTFDTERMLEIQGEVTRILWRNPHIRLVVRTSLGEAQADWAIEGGAVSRLSRWGVGEGMLEIGDTIRLAGFPSKRRPNELYAQNLLLPDGREVLMDYRSPARWRDDAIGGQRLSTGASNSSLGIFRVWTGDGQRYDKEVDSYPLTDAARTAQEAWDPVRDNPYFGCMPKGMPTIMQQPFPIEFTDQGDEIHLHIEEYDLIRVISMREGTTSSSVPPTILGDSVGYWEDESLVVTTTNIDWPYSFGQVGIPQSDAVELVERFTIMDGSGRLEYEITSIDPVTYAEPLTLMKSFLWVPGLELLPYECTDG